MCVYAHRERGGKREIDRQIDWLAREADRQTDLEICRNGDGDRQICRFKDAFRQVGRLVGM